MNDNPTFVYRDGMIADREYVQWLSEVKTRFRQSQIKASIRVNTAMLELYWSIGRDLVRMRAEERWGTGLVKQFALDMREAFPDATGFSYRNIRYMRQWYSFYYTEISKWQQVAAKTENSKWQQTAAKFGQQATDYMEMPVIFGQIPWFHHVQIISNCHTCEEAFFYINKVIQEGWSRSQLEHQIETQLYSRQGSAVSNFERTLPAMQSKLAQEILKDPYEFGFLAMKAKYDERDLEDALVSNVTRFLLELGKGFSYVGRQMELQMPGGQTFFPDLVFYHIPQHRYVIIELKAVKYIPDFAGKLNFYVTAADELLRGDGDNPSVGLLICKSTDKTVVEWSLKDINKPLGVATYQLQEVVDRTVAELEQYMKEKHF